MKRCVLFVALGLFLVSCRGTDVSDLSVDESAASSSESGSASVSEGEAVAALQMKTVTSSTTGVSTIQFVVDVTFADQSQKEGVSYRVLDPQSKRLHQVLWESSAKEVAVINDKGLLTPAATGETLVTASIGDKSMTTYLIIQKQNADGGTRLSGDEGFDVDVALNVDPEDYVDVVSNNAHAEPEPSHSEEEACDPLTTDRDPFADRVVSYEKGEGGGYHEELLPEIVLGPPHAHPSAPLNGSFDVVSLGREGEIILEFTDYEICDGDGFDFIVFENPWQYNSDAKYGTYTEPATVSVSTDGIHFFDFPCDLESRDHRGCSGVHAVLANPDLNDIDPTDPEKAGGDPFDLSEVGLIHARFVRIRDGNRTFGPAGNGMRGFDLDAVAVVNGRNR